MMGSIFYKDKNTNEVYAYDQEQIDSGGLVIPPKGVLNLMQYPIKDL